MQEKLSWVDIGLRMQRPAPMCSRQYHMHLERRGTWRQGMHNDSCLLIELLTHTGAWTPEEMTQLRNIMRELDERGIKHYLTHLPGLLIEIFSCDTVVEVLAIWQPGGTIKFYWEMSILGQR